MAPNELRELLHQEPFEPLRLHLSTGLTFEIRHPEVAMVKLSVVWLFFPPATAPLPLAERKVVVALRHIVYVDFIAPAPTA